MIMRARSVSLALVVALAAATLQPARAGVPSVEECLEASDFIANAARARDNGLARERFLDRMDADFTAVRAFPPGLRWFVHDGEDESFLRDSVQSVFDQPATPEDHRSAFLRACFDRMRA